MATTPTVPGATSPGALVTGGARGIGRAIATALARRGGRVTVADVDVQAVTATVDALRADGLDVHAVPLDVTDAGDVRRVIEAADAHDPLGTVVANAGVSRAVPLLDIAPEDFDTLMAVNLRGAFFTLQAAARVMVPRRAGSVVLLSSIAAFSASSVAMAHYDASKGAVRALTVSAAHELAEAGVRVNAVAPGVVDTGLTRSLATAPDSLERLAQRRIPIQRLARPEEIASAVAYLSSSAASYVSGHVLVVDGGWLA